MARSPSKFLSTPAHATRTRCFAMRVVILGIFMNCAAPLLAGQEDIAPEPAPPGTHIELSVTNLGTVNMHVSDLPLAEALRLLSVQGQRNIVTSPSVTGTVSANFYGVTFEEALEAILVANSAGFITVGNFIYVYTLEELAQMDEAANPPITQVFPLNYIAASEAKDYLTPLLGDNVKIAASPTAKEGLASSAEEGGGAADAMQDFIIVSASQDKLDEVARILREIDLRPKQVLIEATILRAELKDDNALGVDFSIVGGVDLQQLGAASTGLTDVRLGELPDVRFERFNAGATTDLNSDMSNGGITVGIIKDNVGIFLRALEQVTDTTVLANPKVLALNKQKGQVIVGRRDGFLTTTVTETQAIQTVEFLETGTQLIFRPFIGNDGYVRMELHPEDSVGFVNAQGLPSEQTTELTTNVMVRDGETILLGGLFREVTIDARKQVPGLGNIPGIGQLFRNNSDSTAREEVIILLTVHIIKDQQAYADASIDVLNDIERVRVGARQGLMWHGRERMAQSHYHKAADAYRLGDKDKALWHCKLALHNQPRLLSALRLKEQILEYREWDDVGAGGRAFLRRLLANERGQSDSTSGQPLHYPTAQNSDDTDER